MSKNRSKFLTYIVALNYHTGNDINSDELYRLLSQHYFHNNTTILHDPLHQSLLDDPEESR